MKATLAANTIVVAALLGWLAQAAVKDVKPIAILHMPRVALAPADIGFQIRLQPEADDRQLWALLCDLSDESPCTTDHHERLSQVDVEGDRAPRLWSPPPWHHVDAGEYAVVAAIGPRGRIRAYASEHLLVAAP